MTEAATLDKHGRLIVPSSFRKRMGWQPGEKLTLTLDDSSMRVASRRQVLDDALAELRAHLPAGESAVEGLLRDRREEVRREEEEIRASQAPCGKKLSLSGGARRG